jgi:RNA polymerase sigma-70 factor (ECF subfamily)
MFTPEEGRESFVDTLPAPEAGQAASDVSHQQQVLETALRKLPAAQRVPVVLYHFEDMSYEEIARQLSVSVGKVKTDIHRGREALRKKLKITLDGEIAPGFIPPTPPAAPQRRTLIGCV